MKQNGHKVLGMISLMFLVVLGNGIEKQHVQPHVVHAKAIEALEPTPTPDEYIGELKYEITDITPTPAPVFKNDIEEYVAYKFGSYYEEAFDIIACESSWNTKAFNDNTWWGGVGQDRGLWQINNAYHPVSDECAHDYQCATNYAYRMWINDDRSFERWTCGR